MSDHFSPAFKAAFARVQAAAENGPQAVKIAFRDEMLNLGHEERVLNLYRIKDKLTGKPVFLRPNKFQLKFLKKRSNKNIILKSRQVGGTVFQAVRENDLMLWEPNFKGAIIADKKDRVSEIFNDKFKLTYDWFKRDWGQYYAPNEKFNSKTSITLINDGLGRELNSSVIVTFDARGYTMQMIHFSESSRIDPKRISGSAEGVPVTGEITHESTPNGMGGFFYNTWQNVKAGVSGFKGFFVPWFEMYPETKIPVPAGFTMTPEEREIADEYDLNDQHILWRRYKIADSFDGDSEQFDEEYPSNDIDCFTSGAGQVYQRDIIKAHNKLCTAPEFTGFLIKDKPVKNKKGWVHIWKYPKLGYSYVIGADPAGGIGRDFSAAYVKCMKTKEIVAKVHGQIEPGDFATDLLKLAKYYNKSFICVEENGHGAAVIQKLKESNYGRLYKRRVIDEMTNRPTQKVGFRTSNSEKLRITEQLKSSLKNMDFKCTDFALIKELSTFVQSKTKGGLFKREASPGAHDDLVMAAALTEEAANQLGTTTMDDEIKVYQTLTRIDPDTGFPI